jgi:TPR repeat protein
MKKLSLFVAATLSVATSNFAIADSVVPLPNSYESVLQKSMDSPVSMVYSADMAYRSGDYTKALHWNLMAAKQLFKPAVENAKFMIQHNMGVTNNRIEVVDFLTYYGTPIGESLGDMFAQLYLADYYSGHNCIWEEFDMTGRNHEERCFDVDDKMEPMSEEQPIKAHYWYTKAAEQGNMRARYTIAMMDILGLGVGRNIPKGLVDLESVANSGHAISSFIIGQIHNTGYWVPQDSKMAFTHLKTAAQAMLPEAQLALANNYVTMRGVDVKDQKEGVLMAIHWLEKTSGSLLASPEQQAQANYYLGEIYSEQRDFLDATKATYHFEKSLSFFDKTPNKWSLKSVMDMAQFAVEADDLLSALNMYLMIESKLPELEQSVQKEFDGALRQAATIYARGTIGLSPDQFKYSEYMKKYHALRASEVIDNNSPDELFGFNAYAY